MKILTVLLLLITTNVFAASAVVRSGEYIDQYAISDPGNVSGLDNVRVIISFGVTEVVIQASGIDNNTSKESLLCWNDNTILECPDDDVGGGVARMPALAFLEEQFLAGTVTVGAPLSDLRQKAIYLAFWHEYRTEKVVEDSIAEMVLEGLNAVQQRRALKYIYFGLGIDLVTAQALANNRITNSIQATYDEYGLATVPQQDRRLLILFGEVGWFE